MDVSYAAGWRPEEGDTIIGTVTEVGMGASQYGGSYPIVTVKPEDGGDPIAVHGFHAALKARFIDLKPMPGERIGIKFLGKRQHKTDANLTVADYVVKIDGRTTTDVWARMEAQSPPPPATDVPVNTADFAPAKPPADDDIPF